MANKAIFPLPCIEGAGTRFSVWRAWAMCGLWILCLAILCLAENAGAQASGPLIVLIGPPGSGKTTQAEILKKENGMILISADSLIEQDRQEFARFRNPEIRGVEPRLDPALNRLVEAALRSSDLSKGVILDGYPASKGQGDYLATLGSELHLAKPIVIRLRVPDDVVRKRLAGEESDVVEQGLKDYHREFDFAHLYFPKAEIHEIDGTKSSVEVAREIRELLKK